MNLLGKIVALSVVIITGLPSWSAPELPQNSAYLGEDDELSKKCPDIVVLYLGGEKTIAQRLAKEILPSIQKKYDNRHGVNRLYDFKSELDVLKAVISNNEKPVLDYQTSHHHDVRLEGLRFGVKEQLAVSEKELSLIAVEPLYGTSSPEYFFQGKIVAPMLYEIGQKEQSKTLANKLLVSLQHLRADKETSTWFGYPFILDEAEAMLKNIIDDNKNAIEQYMMGHYQIEDSVGNRLEEAYGQVYMYKKLHNALNLKNNVAYAYRYLGYIQAIVGNYDESERAYSTALRLAQEKYGDDYPEIPVQVRSEYAGMLKLAGKADEAAKLSAGLTPQCLNEAKVKGETYRMRNEFSLMVPAPGWGQ